MSRTEDKLKVEALLKEVREKIAEANSIANRNGLQVKTNYDSDIFLAKEWDHSACWEDPDVWDSSAEEEWESSWEDSGC